MNLQNILYSGGCDEASVRQYRAGDGSFDGDGFPCVERLLPGGGKNAFKNP